MLCLKLLLVWVTVVEWGTILVSEWLGVSWMETVCPFFDLD
jgi:hypothetical protein